MAYEFYVDTSVFGGYFEQEFQEDTILFFKYLNEKNIQILYSEVTQRELEGAPSKIQDMVSSLTNMEFVLRQ